MPYVAKPASRLNFRDYAAYIRKSVGLENKPYFPIVEFMELVMPDMFPGFNYEIVDDNDPMLKGCEGLTLPNENLILLPDAVYADAVAGQGRARYTVTHEVSHYLTIDNGSISLARPSKNIPAYRDPEWQANTLASEILIVPRLSKGMTAAEIADTFGVSLKAASIHLNVKAKEGLL